MSTLNPEQQQAVKILKGPALVIAGAGSGKSRVVTSRIVHLIEQGVPPERILGVTFTNKAAKEMQTRVEKLTDHYVLISTFHSLGARILRESIGALGWKNDFAIYDEEDVKKVLRHVLQALEIKDKKLDVKTCRSLISRAKQEMVLPEQAEKSFFFKKEDPRLSRIYQEYCRRMKESQALDFDDLLFFTVRTFRESPTQKEKWQSRFDFVLVDEYQDTNPAQYEICQTLVEKHKNFFVVGDPDQMIYSWRGAKLETILNFQKDYPEAKTIYLEQNYRSSPEILEAANALIQHNENRLEKNLWSTLHPGEKIRLFTALDEREEANFVAQNISRLHEKQAIPFQEMAIFYRTNAQSRPFEDCLLSYQIPYHIVGGISFYQRKEIKDILSFLRLINNPSDFISLARTINLPKRGIGEATLEKIRLLASQENISLLQCLQGLIRGEFSLRLSEKQKTALRSYLKMILDLKEKDLSLKDLVQKILDDCYFEVLKQDEESFQERFENVNELIAKASEWEGMGLEAFLEELSLKSSLDLASESKTSLALMTLHNGKGLEFTAVFLAGLEENLLPHVNSKEKMEHLEEERRLCYVGMTRAKQLLFLSYSLNRFLFGGERRQYPSRFLKEIPMHCLQKVTRSRSI